MQEIDTQNPYKTETYYCQKFKFRSKKAGSFRWERPVDYTELEAVEEKNLFLCVELPNSDKTMIRVGKKTTAKQVLERLLKLKKVKKELVTGKSLELILTACKWLKENYPLPSYFVIWSLHKLGFWSKPWIYSQSPILTVREKTLSESKGFRMPGLLVPACDPLIASSEWCSYNNEVIAFRVKYINDPTIEEVSVNYSFGRYPQFVDKSEDFMKKEKEGLIAVYLEGDILSKTIIKINTKMTLRELLENLKVKYESKTGRQLNVENKVLKFKKRSEYIWEKELRLFHIEGIREAIDKNMIPDLELRLRPKDLYVQGDLPSYEYYDIIVPMVTGILQKIYTHLDVSCFPQNDIDLDDETTLQEIIDKRRSIAVIDKPEYFMKRAQTFEDMKSIYMPPVEQKRPKTLPFTQSNAKFRRPIIKRRFSSIKETGTDLNSIKKLEFIDSRTLHRPFRFKVVGVEHLRMHNADEDSNPVQRINPSNIRVEAYLFSGDTKLDSQSLRTSYSYSGKNIRNEYFENVRWYEWMSSSFLYSQLPLPATIKFVVKGWVSGKDPREREVGWVKFRIFDYENKLQTGTHRLGIFPFYTKNFTSGATLQNLDPDASQLFIQLDSFVKPVVFGQERDSNFYLEEFLNERNLGLHPLDEKEVNRVIFESPLYELTEYEKELVWRYRAFLSSVPDSFPKLLLSVDWCDPLAVRDLYHILDLCSKPSPVIAMELLDSKFADPKVRQFAVSSLEQISNNELQQFLLQLIQALKFEPFHDSALAKFLLRRAIKFPESIGHNFFWLLRSEMHDPYYKERYGLLLEQYLRRCGAHRNSLVWEDHLMKNLERIAWHVQSERQLKREEVLEHLKSELSVLNQEMPEFYTLPNNPKLLVKKIKCEECKFMKSKKRPLYLVFESVDSADPDVHMLFKVGDDLRQDMLTLQILKVMESLWLHEGLDLKMSLYSTLALGNNVGLLEVVDSSSTLAEIQKWGGGQIGVFNEKTLYKWLKQFEEPDSQENFIRSCAGYCVATYVLGIADRHNDNIMLKTSGHLFHIDFGHFLGYFKTKLGIKRETAPFVFTPDMCYTMGGKKSEGYKQFQEYCVQAYKVLNQNKRLLISLLALMLCSGIRELTRHDLGYLDKTLVDLSDERLEKRFKSLIKKSLRNPMTRINFSIHILAN